MIIRKSIKPFQSSPDSLFFSVFKNLINTNCFLCLFFEIDMCMNFDFAKYSTETSIRKSVYFDSSQTLQKNCENFRKELKQTADNWRKLQKRKFKIRNCFSLNYMCFKKERNWKRREEFFCSSTEDQKKI